MSEDPPFAPGQQVWTDWLRRGRWEPCTVARCEPFGHASQTGWRVVVDGGLRISRQDHRRIAGVDSGWFRDHDPKAKA